MISLKRLFILVFIVTSISMVSFTRAQESSPLLNDEMKQQTLNKISQLIRDNYVSEEIGKTCADFLSEQIENESYEDITHPREFARELTSDLNKIHKDKHIRIQFLPPEDKRLVKNQRLDFFLRTRDRIKDNLGFRKINILPGNVGYIDIRSFEPFELALNKALSALHFLENADAIIVDLRNNVGGSPTMVQFLSSYFFDKPVHLNDIYWRRGDYTEEFWTFDSIGIKKRPNVPVYILTSKKTFSGGEEFAYSLKNQNRATLIGEKTAGAANPGYTFSINEAFNIFIPTGYSVNPVTGSNWEGKGVDPDISMKSKEALSFAMEKAEQAARIYREKSDDQAVMSYLKLCAELDQMDTLIARGNTDSARSVIKLPLQNAINSDFLNEWMINDLGYRYLSKKKFTSAILLFQYNRSQYPNSYNVYDSLGEAFMKAGENTMAIENYEKSLNINPRNENARYMLSKLRQDKN